MTTDCSQRRENSLTLIIEFINLNKYEPESQLTHLLPVLYH